MLDLEQLRQAISRHAIDCVYLNKVDCLPLFAQSRYAGIPVLLKTGDPSVEEIEILESFEDVEPGTDLQPALIALKLFVEKEIGCPLAGIGLGPERDRTWRFPYSEGEAR